MPQYVEDARLLSSPPGPRPRPLAVAPLFRARAIGGGAWSPDGGEVAFVANLSGRLNLWSVRVPSPTASGEVVGPAWPRQLTFSQQRQAQPAWSPAGDWIAFISDRDGDEQWDVFLLSTAGGEVRNLTNEPDAAYESPAWSPDGQVLAWSRKPRSGSSFEIEIATQPWDAARRRVRRLTRDTPADYGNDSPLWSPNGRRLAWTRSHATGKNADVVVADLGEPGAAADPSAPLATRLVTAAARAQLPAAAEAVFSAAAWTADGRRLLITANSAPGDARGFDNVALLDVETGDLEWLTRERWECSAGACSADGRFAAWESNRDGESQVFLHDFSARTTRPVPLPAGVALLSGAESAFSRAPGGGGNNAARLLLSRSGPEAANELWVYDPARPDTPARAITDARVAGVNAADCAAPARARFRSRDGRWLISAWVYAPAGIARDGSHPGVVYIHGGPAAQAMNGFNRAIQLLASRGCVVIAPNYRGSTGYGQAFHDANQGDLGGGDLQDVLAAADWLLDSGFVRRDRLAVMGGSYGGYLTTLALARAPDYWAAGAATVPFVNWFTEIANEDPLLRQYDLATMGDPEVNRELYRERSPIFFADRIRAPLLLLAGAQDPRCPPAEAEQMAAAVRAAGGRAELHIFPDEGHGFARVENQIAAHERIVAFLAGALSLAG